MLQFVAVRLRSAILPRAVAVMLTLMLLSMQLYGDDPSCKGKKDSLDDSALCSWLSPMQKRADRVRGFGSHASREPVDDRPDV